MFGLTRQLMDFFSLVKSFELIEFCQLKNIANGIELEYGDVIITKDMLRSITKVNI